MNKLARHKSIGRLAILLLLGLGTTIGVSWFGSEFAGGDCMELRSRQDGRVETVRNVGWPLPALWCSQAEFEELRGATPLPDPLGLRSFNPGQHSRGLPYLPIWSGLLANTAFFSAAWLSIFVAIPVTRRAHRLRRGHCPMCRYDLKHDLAAGCPECGWRRA